MGRASKWFKSLLGFKTPQPNGDPARRPPSKKRWSFSKGRDRQNKSQDGVVAGGYANDDEANRHAVAVAAATAAVAEAAVAAAQAAAAVVHLTSGGGFDRPSAYSGPNGTGSGSREDRAAVVIQSHFRAYLSRRALRALRALVRLQALVRGRIQRKQNAHKLRQLQAIVRAQARAHSARIPASEAPHSTTKPSRFVRASPEKVEQRSKKSEQPMMSMKNGSRSSNKNSHDHEKSPLIHQWIERRKGEASSEYGSYTRSLAPDDDKSDKILEVDTGKPNMITPKRRTTFNSSDQYYHTFYPPSPSQSLDGSPFYTATNSPQYYYASSLDGSSKRGRNLFTPTKSDSSSRSCLNGYTDHPSYMAYTESAKAKARSVSAPKQRPQWERSSSVNRFSLPGFGEQKCSTLQASFSMKAYPGSGRLDRMGMPVRDISGFSGGLCHRY